MRQQLVKCLLLAVEHTDTRTCAAVCRDLLAARSRHGVLLERRYDIAVFTYMYMYTAAVVLYLGWLFTPGVHLCRYVRADGGTAEREEKPQGPLAARAHRGQGHDQAPRRQVPQKERRHTSTFTRTANV